MKRDMSLNSLFSKTEENLHKRQLVNSNNKRTNLLEAYKKFSDGLNKNKSNFNSLIIETEENSSSKMKRAHSRQISPTNKKVSGKI